jgi:hypothetical protein
LIAVLGVVAVVLTRKLMTACEPVQLAEAMKPAGGTSGGTAGNVHPSPFWNARPVCQESTKPCFWAFETTTRKLISVPGVTVTLVLPLAQLPGAGQMVFVIVVVA